MEVIKTLVIGLGSSGIEVCDRVIERIRWELGDVRRAPWVRFLGIETNTTVETDLREMGDLLLLTIPANEYSLLIQKPQDYEEKLHISEWADLDVLRALPSNEVTAGAGNIRMVGRLVFFYRYDEISREVSRRLNELRNLTPAQAMEQRGELLSGENPTLTFVGSIRIFVVGTLCGGTCSGMVGDFGFFLRLLTNPDERIIGMFTLPPPNLTTAVQPKANRFKKNAYTALVELNHYHLVHRKHEPLITFPDGQRVDLSQTPYDHPYLLFPKGVSGKEINSLHQIMADRIFLNIFAPGTDSFRRTVDAPQVSGTKGEDVIRGDRFHRAHVFLNVGIATMEYPAERIIAACTNRQLAYTLRQWNHRTLSDHEINSRLKELGIEWDKLCEWLFHTPSGESIDSAAKRYANEIANLVTSAPEQARHKLNDLRQAFEESGIVPAPPNQVLYRGAVISTCLQNKDHALRQFLIAVRALVGRDLLDYYVGPAALRDLMQKAQDRLQKLLQQHKPDIRDAVDRANRLLERIERCKRSRKLAITGLRRKELSRLRSEFKKALDEEIDQRLKAAALVALRDLPSGQATEQQGLISMLNREVDILKRRLNNLVSRVARQSELFDRDDNQLSRSEPEVAGVKLFRPDPDGTVTEEYHRCLEQSASQGITWQQQRELLAQSILRGWHNLEAHVVPSAKVQPHEDWLYQEFRPHAEDPFPRSLLEPIINEARRPFLQILKADVFEKWWDFYTEPTARAEHAREVVRRVNPSVRVDRFLAERGGRSPIATWSALALPSQGQHRRDFLETIRRVSEFPMDCEETDSPFSYRIIMLQEWHRWPLSGVPDITKPPEGLCTAECGDFPSFHTRKDVAWIPLTDEEVLRLEQARAWLIIGVLCGFVVPRGGALEIERSTGLLGENIWRLPLSLDDAARQIAIIGRDQKGQPLDSVMDVLKHRVSAKRSEYKGDDDAFIRFLADQLRHRGRGSEIPGWDIEEGKRVIVKFCSADEQLRQALMRVNPLPDEEKNRLWKKAGDPKPRGGTYEEPGYYCSICGGSIGKNEEEALQNGWCCYVDPSHCFYNLEL
ncbi:MAG: tubulin-like doman-containing protein [Armatimonadota bacterium]